MNNRRRIDDEKVKDFKGTLKKLVKYLRPYHKVLLFVFFVAILSTIFTFPSDLVRYIVIGVIYIFGIIMVSIYAPADTENLPILTKKERKVKKILSYVFLTINMIGAVIIPNTVIQNLIIFGTFVQTISITRIAYIITKNKYGYEVYMQQQNQVA